jgi:hypothetical protein
MAEDDHHFVSVTRIQKVTIHQTADRLVDEIVDNG